MNCPAICLSLLLTTNLCPDSVAALGQSGNSRATPAQIPVVPELIPYLHVRSIIHFTQRELIELMPELKNLEFEQDQGVLESILQKIGEAMDGFFRDFPNTTSLENVYQERVDPAGNMDQYLKRKYHYVISTSSEKDVFGLEEYRTQTQLRPWPTTSGQASRG